MPKYKKELKFAVINKAILLHLFFSSFIGCYSLLPTDEINNGIPEDSRTWKYYQIIWKPGEKPNLERMLENYYSGDCNQGCVYEYILTVNLIEELSEYQIKNQKDKIPEGSWISLGEIDTCGTKYCKGRIIPYIQLLGDLKEEIREFTGKKRRIPLNVNQSENATQWNYFRINAKTSDDTLFTLLQNDLGINPYLDSYTITVNITDLNPFNRYIVIGDEADPSAQRWPWSQLSKLMQDGLINWTKPNKVNFSIDKW